MKLYLITNLKNGKKYVGITSQTLKLRWMSHCNSPAKGVKRSALQSAIVMHGRAAFKMEHYASARTYEDLLALEMFVIEQEQSLTSQNGYNITKGGRGCGGRTLSPETRAKISAAMTGSKHLVGKKLSPEAIAKRSAARRGVPHSAEGIARIRAGLANRGPLSEEHKAKIGRAHRGRTIAPEIGAKISAAKKGKRFTPEHCAAISAAKKGTSWSPQSRARKSAAMLATWAARRSHESNRAAALVIENAAHNSAKVITHEV